MTNIMYLAGPIGDGHTVGPRKMYSNVRQAELVMYWLMQRGWSVIAPQLSYHCWINWPTDMPWHRWMEQDYELLQKADALFYMIPEIYGTSRGAKREADWSAEFSNIKTIYTDLDDVPIVTPPQLELENKK